MSGSVVHHVSRPRFAALLHFRVLCGFPLLSERYHCMIVNDFLGVLNLKQGIVSYSLPSMTDFS